LVEDNGLMRDLGNVVLAQALDQAAQWHRRGPQLTVAVNLPASSLVDIDLPNRIMGLLADRALPAEALHLEITEEFLAADRARARARTMLTRLRELGLQIAVDDFGTGFSSLVYLRDLPIDELKLDHVFVLPMADDARAAALVISTINLAHSLGLRIVAEGVENRTTLTKLTEHGCDQAQGYYLSPPVPAAELDTWLVHADRGNPQRHRGGSRLDKSWRVSPRSATGPARRCGACCAMLVRCGCQGRERDEVGGKRRFG